MSSECGSLESPLASEPMGAFPCRHHVDPPSRTAASWWPPRNTRPAAASLERWARSARACAAGLVAVLLAGCHSQPGPSLPGVAIQVPSGAGAEVQNAVEGLNSPDPIHRASAAAALGEVHGEGELVARVLLEALRDGHRRVRASAAASLGKTGQLAAANALTNLLKNPAEDCDVRASAAESLGRLQAGQAAAALMAAAQDPVWFLRYQAVVAMGRIGDPAFERALADAVRYEANAMVRSAAQESLRHLKASGRNGGINGAAEDSRRPAKEVAGTRKDD